MAQPAAVRPGGGGRTGQSAGLMVIRVVVGVFLLFQGFEKLSWLLDTGPLTRQLAGWLETATPASRWYLERLLPATPLFARFVPLGEIGAGLALIVGFWTRLAAGLAFLMVLNYQVADGAVFRYSFVTLPNALPVLGALLGLTIGGGRLPLSVSK
jgi:uncharacterized membrane protein YphA (DoxX/SURF4 family)